VPSSRRTGDQAEHAGLVKASHSICPVCTMGVADWLPIQQHVNRGTAGAPRLHDQVHFAASEREHNLPRASLELDVLTFALPVA
jgi:hypothetical protein